MLTRWSEIPLLFKKFCVIILRILILFPLTCFIISIFCCFLNLCIIWGLVGLTGLSRYFFPFCFFKSKNVKLRSKLEKYSLSDQRFQQISSLAILILYTRVPYFVAMLFMQRHQVIMDPEVKFCCFFSCGFRKQQFAIGSIALCLWQCFLWRVVFPFPECFCLFNITPLSCPRPRAADFHRSRLKRIYGFCWFCPFGCEIISSTYPLTTEILASKSAEH